MKTSSIYLLIALLLAGCQQQQEAEATKEEPVVADTEQVAANDETAQAAESDDDAYWDGITQLYEQAKASGQTTAENASEWLGEVYDKTTTASKNAADVTASHVEKMYQDAKQRGETTATSAKDWVLDDISRMGAWEYKTLSVASNDPSEIESKLNELGAQRWDCFHADQRGATTTFYFKKPTRSYLRQIPARELLKLIPLLGTGGEDPGE